MVATAHNYIVWSHSKMFAQMYTNSLHLGFSLCRNRTGSSPISDWTITTNKSTQKSKAGVGGPIGLTENGASFAVADCRVRRFALGRGCGANEQAKFANTTILTHLRREILH